MHNVTLLRFLAVLLSSLAVFAGGCSDPDEDAVQSAYESGEAAIGARNVDALLKLYTTQARTNLEAIVKAAKTATREETRKLAPHVMFEVLHLRLACPPERLKNMDVNDYVLWLIDEEELVVDADYGVSLKSVKVNGDRATLMLRVEGFSDLLAYEMVRENGEWKYPDFSDPRSQRDLVREATAMGPNYHDGMLKYVCSEHGLKESQTAWDPPR